MAVRRRPATLTLRVTEVNEAMAKTLARSEGLSVSECLHRLLVPAIRQRVAELALAEDEENDGADPNTGAGSNLCGGATPQPYRCTSAATAITPRARG